MIPVFRIRDGRNSLQRNKNQFSQVSELLAKGIPVGIFPEANHAKPRKLRTLRKGITRIAFQAEKTITGS